MFISLLNRFPIALNSKVRIILIWSFKHVTSLYNSVTSTQTFHGHIIQFLNLGAILRLRIDGFQRRDVSHFQCMWEGRECASSKVPQQDETEFLNQRLRRVTGVWRPGHPPRHLDPPPLPGEQSAHSPPHPASARGDVYRRGLPPNDGQGPKCWPELPVRPGAVWLAEVDGPQGSGLWAGRPPGWWASIRSNSVNEGGWSWCCWR